MTTPASLTCVATSTLATINQAVAQNEAVYGPLISIGNDGSQTVLTFDSDGNPPAKSAVIAADQGGQPVVPAGSTQVCQGQIFIAGTLTPATASRPN